MAVLLNVRKHWPTAQTEAEKAGAVLGEWHRLRDESLAHGADVLIALVPDSENVERVVATFDVVADADGKRWHRTDDDRVIFHGKASTRYQYLVGQRWPEPVFSRRGAARGARYFPTAELPPPPPSQGLGSASTDLVFNGIHLTIDADGVTVARVQQGAALKVIAT